MNKWQWRIITVICLLVHMSQLWRILRRHPQISVKELQCHPQSQYLYHPYDSMHIYYMYVWLCLYVVRILYIIYYRHPWKSGLNTAGLVQLHGTHRLRRSQKRRDLDQKRMTKYKYKFEKSWQKWLSGQHLYTIVSIGIPMEVAARFKRATFKLSCKTQAKRKKYRLTPIAFPNGNEPFNCKQNRFPHPPV